jgi:hypothetical protein
MKNKTQRHSQSRQRWMKEHSSSIHIYVMCVVHAGFISSAYCAWYRGKEAKMKKKKKWKNESFKSNIPNGNLIRANGPDAILYSIYIRTYVDIPILYTLDSSNVWLHRRWLKRWIVGGTFFFLPPTGLKRKIKWYKEWLLG